MEIKELCKIIDENREEIFSLLSDFIKINSENFGFKGNEEAMARYIYDVCSELGLECDTYCPLEIEGFENHPDYFPGRGLETRYNTVARWKGETDEDELMIMGHLDTMPIGDIANWTVDPMGGEIKDGKVYGRGACDDKYALATAVFLIKLLKRYGFVPKKNLLFAAYCDEENGGSHGALAAVMKYPCKKVVNMDGRSEIWNCASGGGEIIYRYHTEKAVDSAYLAASAISVVLETMKGFAENRREELQRNKYYDGTIIPDTSLRYNEVCAGKNGTDLGVGFLRFTFYTDKSKEEIYAELDAIEKILAEKLRPLGIIGDGFSPHTRFFHYQTCSPEAQIVKEMLAAANEATGKQLGICGSCLSDLSVIMKHCGGEAIAYGAGRDFSLEGGAHQRDEFIYCDDLVNYVKNIGALILKVLG